MYLASDKLARLDPTRSAVEVPVVSRANALPGLRLRLERDGASPERQLVRSVAEEARAPPGERQEWYSLGLPVDGSESRDGWLRSLRRHGGLRWQ